MNKKNVVVSKFQKTDFELNDSDDGFNEITLGEFANPFKFTDENSTIIGRFVEVKKIECPMKGKNNKGKIETRRLMILSTRSGNFSIWDSAKLRELLDMAEQGKFEGKTIKIQYMGKIKTPNGYMKDFRAYTK